jgi:hypothetical protein
MSGHNQDRVAQSWEKLLHPQTLRSNLLLASLYLSAYEILRGALIDRIQSFFTLGFEDEGGKPVVDEQYDEVKQLHEDVFLGSCFWLQQNGAISGDDVDEIVAIRRHRNQIAHELPSFLGDVSREISLERLRNILHILKKIEIWWVRNVDLVANPDFDNVEVADEDIYPGRVLILNEIVCIALYENNRE